MGKLNSFVINSSRKITIGVNIKVNVKKWGRGNCFYCFFYLKVNVSLLQAKFTKIRNTRFLVFLYGN